MGAGPIVSFNAQTVEAIRPSQLGAHHPRKKGADIGQTIGIGEDARPVTIPEKGVGGGAMGPPWEETPKPGEPRQDVEDTLSLADINLVVTTCRLGTLDAGILFNGLEAHSHIRK